MPIRIAGTVAAPPRRYRTEYAAEVCNALDEHYGNGAAGFLRFETDTPEEATSVGNIARGHIRENYPGMTANVRKDSTDPCVMLIAFGEFKPRGPRPSVNKDGSPRKQRSKRAATVA